MNQGFWEHDWLWKAESQCEKQLLSIRGLKRALFMVLPWSRCWNFILQACNSQHLVAYFRFSFPLPPSSLRHGEITENSSHYPAVEAEESEALLRCSSCSLKFRCKVGDSDARWGNVSSSLTDYKDFLNFFYKEPKKIKGLIATEWNESNKNILSIHPLLYQLESCFTTY